MCARERCIETGRRRSECVITIANAFRLSSDAITRYASINRDALGRIKLAPALAQFSHGGCKVGEKHSFIFCVSIKVRFESCGWVSNPTSREKTKDMEGFQVFVNEHMRRHLDLREALGRWRATANVKGPGGILSENKSCQT